MESNSVESLRDHLWSEEIWQVRQGLVKLSSSIDAVRKGVIQDKSSVITEDILPRLFEIQRKFFSTDPRTTLYILTLVRDCLHNCGLEVYEAALEKFDLIEFLSEFTSSDDTRLVYIAVSCLCFIASVDPSPKLQEKGYFDSLYELSKKPMLDSTLCETIAWGVKVGLQIPRPEGDEKVFFTKCIEILAKLVPNQMRPNQLMEIIETAELVLDEADGAVNWKTTEKELIQALFEVVPFLKEDTRNLDDRFLNLLTKVAPYVTFSFIEADQLAFESLLVIMRREDEKISGFSFITALSFYEHHAQLLTRFIKHSCFARIFEEILQNDDIAEMVNLVYFVNQTVASSSFNSFLMRNPALKEGLLKKLEVIKSLEGADIGDSKLEMILETARRSLQELKLVDAKADEI
eukprot:TRINITY_DN10006_c0_g1_i1.p1 TRINITY_DN10006_c0_g1~~TRINITY_DN10006_c0_g1_i1.p1  ORF type:complete len:405 (+),score=61.06 TRINITY_DN10006_c0_g1_i1:179-1393(+)